MKIFKMLIVALVIVMYSVCSYACDSSKGAYVDSTYWATSSSDTARVAMINGDKVYYSAMSDKKDNYDPEIFTYIGYGYVYSIYGIEQSGRGMAHFYLKNNLTVNIERGVRQ